MPEKTDSNNNEIIVDNNTTNNDINHKSSSNIYLDKNKRSFWIREKQVEGNITAPNDNEHNNSNNMHSILQPPTNNT